MTKSAPKNDGKDWARRIMDNIKSGRKVSHYAQRCAREALGLRNPESTTQPTGNAKADQSQPAA